ncbi:MAG TPA: hypothetical protein VGC09_18130, partial [Rhodopila sp.]
TIARNFRQPPDCHEYPGLERLVCFKLSPQTLETIRYVQQHSAPSDPVFIGLPRHDRIFVNAVTPYFVMNRPVPTKWHQFDPGLQTSSPIQQEMVDELRRVQPRLVIIDDAGGFPHEPNESSLSSGVTVLDDYLLQTYATTAVFGRSKVLVIRGKTMPLRSSGDAAGPATHVVSACAPDRARCGPH